MVRPSSPKVYLRKVLRLWAITYCCCHNEPVRCPEEMRNSTRLPPATLGFSTHYSQNYSGLSCHTKVNIWQLCGNILPHRLPFQSLNKWCKISEVLFIYYILYNISFLYCIIYHFSHSIITLKGLLVVIFIQHRMIESNNTRKRTHTKNKDNAKQDLNNANNKTSHLLAIYYSITTLENFDINLTMCVGMISLGSLI